MAMRFGLLSDDLWRLRAELARALDGEPRRLAVATPLGCDEIVGWSGPRGRLARGVARLTGLPFRGVSIGPLGFVRPDGRSPPTSLVIDGLAGSGSTGVERVASCLALLRSLRLSWRNDGRDRLPFRPAGRPVVVRVVGAGSVPWAERPPERDAILAVVAESREPSGAAAAYAAGLPGAVPVAGTNPWTLFDVAARVEAVPGDLSRLAKIAGIPVAGSTTDEPAEDLFARTFLAEPIYLDAWSREPSDFETAADQLSWLRDRFGENDRRSVCVGVSRWKAKSVARFLDGPDGPAVMEPSADAAVARAAAQGGRIVAWETRMPASLGARCAEAAVPLLRMEDGFLRSVGLGAAFLPGASCVLDGRGIYYDPGQPSDLEHILATAEFGPDLVERAARLRQQVVALRLSKYNVGTASALGDLPVGRQIVLVPGQVEDDASVLLGSPSCPTNLALLRAARARNPDAVLIFKPHPDVEAGLRRGRLAEADTRALADRVIADVSIVDLFDRVDRVETMTSLAGFEALIRGKDTIVHGRPFYSGWGLTTDLDAPERRVRRLSLDELVAGALILYPRYLDPVTGQRCPPEVLVRRLAEARDAARRRPAAIGSAHATYARARHALLDPLAAVLRRRRGAVRGVRPPGNSG